MQQEDHPGTINSDLVFFYLCTNWSLPSLALIRAGLGLILFMCSGFGRCDAAGCRNASVVDTELVGAIVDGPLPGRSSAVRLGANDQSSWILIGEATKFKNLSSFTAEVKSMQISLCQIASRCALNSRCI